MNLHKVLQVGRYLSTMQGGKDFSTWQHFHMLWTYRERNAAGAFDEASYTVLTQHLLRDSSTTARELEVLKSHLVVCFNDRRKHQFHLQLKDRFLHRTIKAFKAEWHQCKQVNFHPCYVSDGSLHKP